MTPALADSLARLAAYLAAHREIILNTWRNACENQPGLVGVTGLNREEFNNKVPFLLNVFEQRLQGQAEEASVLLLAGEHGLHRWQKGYALAELLTEMQLLQRILLEQFRQYWQTYPPADRDLVATAYEYLFEFSQQISAASISEYANLQRLTAVSRVDALEETLRELNAINQQRSDLLWRSSHDLRGSFGVIQGAASLLERVADSEEERQQMLAMLQRNLANSQAMVGQLIDLARLEAGQEPLHKVTVDVSQLLTRLVADYQSLAQEKGLLLTAAGSNELQVETDPILLQRILQNLLINAIKHTPTTAEQPGWVSVSWSREGDYRWILSVQDSGPGLATAGQTGSLAQVLAPASESTAAYGLPSPEADTQEAATTQTSQSPLSQKGEGIGLSIVKSLSELLRGSLDIESKPGQGTLFRLRFPLH